MRILFMCVANAARSQMAEGWARALARPDVVIHSAGSDPTQVRPEAITVMREVGIDLSGQTSKSSFDVPEPDVVIALSEEEVAPAWPDRVERVRWTLPDPAAITGSRAERDAAFRAARDRLRELVEAWLTERGRRFGADPAWPEAFALQPGMAFVNHGSFGATPVAVLEGQRRIIRELEAQPVRFMSRLGERLARVHARLGALLHVDAAHLALVENATTGVNTVLRSIDYAPGDTIVTTSWMYGAVARTLDYLTKRYGVHVHVIALPFPCPGPPAVLEALEAQWPEQARIAVFDHLASGTALVAPIRKMVAFAHDRDVPVVVDGAHVPGQLPVDLAATGADWWVGNLHKWLFAPKGAAVLYARQPDALDPLVISHGYGSGMRAFDWVGTRDPSSWLAVDDALDFAERIGGLDRIRVYNRDRLDHFASLVADRLGVERIAPPEMTALMETLPLPGAPSGDPEGWMQRLWDAHQVEAKLESIDDALHVRLSSQLYNRGEDYDRLAKALLAEV
ncbi:MAG: aminotransferase class V-fold PLP-dependent enzyme [Myxococcota bacterium]